MTTTTSFKRRLTKYWQPTSAASDCGGTPGRDKPARPPDSERLCADGKQDSTSRGKPGVPEKTFGARKTRHSVHKPPISSGTVAVVPLAGLFFVYQKLVGGRDRRRELGERVFVRGRGAFGREKWLSGSSCIRERTPPPWGPRSGWRRSEPGQPLCAIRRRARLTVLASALACRSSTR